MRKWIIALLLSVLWAESFCQDDDSRHALLREADRYYEEEQFNLALRLYRELADLDPHEPRIDYHLAECYRKTFDYTEAETYYLKVCYLAPQEFPLALFYYALMLKLNAHFDESLRYFDEFINRHQATGTLNEFVEQAIIERAGSEMGKTPTVSPYSLTGLSLNTPYNDYAPAIRDSTSLVITSGRVTSNRQPIDERYGEAFTDNYYFERQDGAWKDRTKPLFSPVNSKYNDGSGCFNSTGDKYYFTVCGSGGPQCRIFLSVRKNNKWSEPIPLNSNVNYKSFESKHPAISHGGDTLVFASNRPGGRGQFDLWMSIQSGNDNWGPAVNLGRSVNTRLDELSPAFTLSPYILFFASNGHQGYGGLDLYMAKKLTTGDTVLHNLDQPFSSTRDDCFISLADHGLYWSSNRPEGQGGFDIFATKIPSVLAFISRLSLKKRDARRDVHLKSRTEKAQRADLQASRLEEKVGYDHLTYEKRRVVEKMLENKAMDLPNTPGQFGDLAPEEFSTLLALAEKHYEEYLEQKTFAQVFLTRIKPSGPSHPERSVTGVLTDLQTGERLRGFRIVLADSAGDVLKITTTNEDGKFRFTGVSAAENLYLKLPSAPDQKEIHPVVTDLEITNDKVYHAYFENIYFDFDHYSIRPEAARVLDALARHLIANPGVQVEIFAFADDRGSNDYNLHLTRKRGESVVRYLTGKGVDQTGLAIVAKGKQVPRSGSALQRQYNRRVEFYVNGNAEGLAEAARTYILKKRTDWAALAQMTGATKEELLALNGAIDEPLKALQPVRIPVHARELPPELFYVGL